MRAQRALTESARRARTRRARYANATSADAWSERYKNAHAVHKASVEMELTKTWNDFQRVLEALKWRATGDVAKATEAGKKQAREAARLEIERAVRGRALEAPLFSWLFLAFWALKSLSKCLRSQGP